MKYITAFCICLLSLSCLNSKAQSGKSNSYDNSLGPVIPVGLDAYRMWDKWPNLRIGDRAYMRSTYDRMGGNHHADASHYLFMGEKEEDNVTLDVIGKGSLCFFRANHWHGSPWQFIVDSNKYIVKETGTADPVHAIKIFEKTNFIPEASFPKPLNWTWGDTKGADLIWSPIPFENSFRIAYSRTRYGTGYYIYHLYANEKNLSQSIHSWNINDTPDKDVLDLINRSGTDIAPKNIEKKSGVINLKTSNKISILDIKDAPSIIRAVKFTLPLDRAISLERARLKITWDNSEYPSVDAPLCLFFGAGTFYNRENKEFLVKGFPVNIRYDYKNNKVELGCYYPMPFFKNAKFELVNSSTVEADINFEIRYEPYSGPQNFTSYFHATYKDMPNPEKGRDLILLDTRGTEGKNEWSGNFAGMSFIFSHDGFLGTLEGDPRFFFDDSKTPQAYGTGTEEWGGGGDYWGGENMTLPFAGHPCGTKKKELAKDSNDLIESAYRFLLADLMPFGKRAEIHLEHGGENQWNEHYESVTYWYGLPAPSLIKSDEVDIGQQWSEEAHNYNSPNASEVEIINSKYEWGVDSMSLGTWQADMSKLFGGSQVIFNKAPEIEIFPATEQDGRHTKGTSAFTCNIRKDNMGILLRRTLDYGFPNQKAEVYIADASDTTQSEADWKFAGIWYLAGSNTVVFSDTSELGTRNYTIQTSNRRFRDDEFLVPANLTKNMSSIHVKIKFLDSNAELYPGYPFPKKPEWSELKYEVYSYVLPDFSLK